MDELKRQAAIRASEFIEDGMVVGLGTGSTVRFLLEVIARGSWRGLTFVSTSRQTEQRAAELGIPISPFRSEVDLTIDGADEVDPNLDLIKGLGAALLREKIVASVSRQLVIIVDESKLVPRLGTRAPLPVEVDPFAADVLPPFFRELGAQPVLRDVVTDGGNRIYDLRFPDGIEDATGLEVALNNRPGVVENGLFLGMADHVVVGTRVLSR